MRVAGISYLPIVGLLVMFSACSRPAPVVPATPAVVVPSVIPASATAPAPETVFVVSELTLNPPVVMLGDNVVVSVKVTNTGKERGAYTV